MIYRTHRHRRPIQVWPAQAAPMQTSANLKESYGRLRIRSGVQNIRRHGKRPRQALVIILSVPI